MIAWLITVASIGIGLWTSPVHGTVDPPNATYFYSTENDDGSISFNITHLYWREHFREFPDAKVGIWVDPYELPAKLNYYADGLWSEIVDTNSIYNIVTRAALDALSEWGVPVERVLFKNHYLRLAKFSNFVDHQPLIPLNRYGRARNDVPFPMEVHFRYKPYPQSSFGEFVTNRAVAWRVWANPREYAASRYVGSDDDLVYRMRHNFGHALGLGHTRSRECIMHPTNVPGLRRHCTEELRAMRVLLRDRNLTAYSHVPNGEPSLTIGPPSQPTFHTRPDDVPRRPRPSNRRRDRYYDPYGL